MKSSEVCIETRDPQPRFQSKTRSLSTIVLIAHFGLPRYSSEADEGRHVGLQENLRGALVRRKTMNVKINARVTTNS